MEDKNSLERVYKASKILIEKGEAVNSITLGKELNLTRQRVSQILVRNNMSLGDFRESLNLGNKSHVCSKTIPILNFLNTLDLNKLSAEEILKLTKETLNVSIKKNYFSHILKENNLRDKNSFFRNNVKNLDTENYTMKELITKFNKKRNVIVGLLNRNNKTYKKVNRFTLKDKLKNINTENYTIKELIELVNYEHEEKYMRAFLYNNNLKYKKKEKNNEYSKKI